MTKKLNSKNKNFYKKLSNFLDSRNENINLRDPKVFKIIDDVKKNGDQALIKYEKKI